MLLREQGASVTQQADSQNTESQTIRLRVLNVFGVYSLEASR
jgi:hypothetical protein